MKSFLLTALGILAITLSTFCFAVISNNKDSLYVGPYQSQVWTEGLKGSFERDFTATQLRATVRSSRGGFDSAFTTNPNGETLVDEVHPNYFVKADYVVSGLGDGYWWVGPKLGMAWSDEPCAPGWFENYVVENSGFSPAELDQRNTASGATYIVETTQDGAVYRHYTVPIDTWTQFWAVRQTYRVGGVAKMKPILNMWRAHGLPNKTIDNLRLNIETDGQIDRVFHIKNIVLPTDFKADPWPAPSETPFSNVIPAFARVQEVATSRYLNASHPTPGATVRSFQDRPEWAAQQSHLEKIEGNLYRIRNDWTGLAHI